MKVVNGLNLSIPVHKMENGQIAIVTKWRYNDVIGRIVQRYDKHLISLGMDSGRSWSNFFDNEHEDCFVQILPKGTLLEV